MGTGDGDKVMGTGGQGGQLGTVGDSTVVIKNIV